jgi:DNA repair photolyase
MQPQIVRIPSIRNPISPSPGFAKKLLADYKLDRLGLCEFGCRYCSSNHGNYLRINRSRFADLTEEQLGIRATPAHNPKLMFDFADFAGKLDAQLRRKPTDWGSGQSLVYSMLTDGFSPSLVRSGETETTLQTVLARTGFRIRVLTKNAIVGSDYWIRFFNAYRDRFVIGLSIGTMDDTWANRVELFTPPPSRRIIALHHLQDAGTPTYGMLCPVLPDMLEGNRLESLVDEIRPDRVEHVWAEPFNDRANWKQVRSGYAPMSAGYKWLKAVYEGGQKHLWSEYATELYVRLRDKARREGWLNKLRYLLYEGGINKSHAEHFRGLRGVLLQGRTADGKSMNQHIAALQ